MVSKEFGGQQFYDLMHISSQLLRFPEEGVAIIVLSNLGSGEAFRKVNGIAEILIDEGVLK